MKKSSRGIIALLGAALIGLTSCSGLPSSGAVQVGLQLDDLEAPPDVLTLAEDPVAGAGPEEIVRGFLNAGIMTDDNWSTARKFLSSEFAETWSPDAGVTIDASSVQRTFTSSLPAEGEGEEDGADEHEDANVDAQEDQVVVELMPTARVDEHGAYSELSGNLAQATFSLARNADGEWRITAADDGIVLDADTFERVYESHALQYFDTTYTHLIPDLRWYPKRAPLPSTLTRALFAGDPSPWLASSVRNAVSGVVLAEDSVVVDSSQIAQVQLATSAVSQDAEILARMRTQLEATLSSIGVAGVRFLVDGRELETERAEVATNVLPSSTRVLTEETFGVIDGATVAEIPGISAEMMSIGSPLSAIEMAADGSLAIAQLESGQVYVVQSDRRIELDGRAGLIRPSLDIYGFVWTVPSQKPTELLAWRTDVVSSAVAAAFPDASGISQLRVAADGTRLAAVVSSGGEQWLAVAAIVRGEGNVPESLGPLLRLSRIDGTARSIVWAGSDTIAVLVDEGENGQMLRLQTVGGPAEESRTPSGAISLAGATNGAGLMVLVDNGVVYERRPTWQQELTGVRVLATQAGF